MQRAKGQARLGFVSENGVNKLSDLHQSGCLKVMLPRNHAAIPDAVLINTAGGLTGGDQLTTRVELGRNAKLRLATQTAERIYQSSDSFASVDLNFSLADKAEFDWLAQETILFNNGQVKRKIEADIAEDASLLIVEPVVLGRAAMGEIVSSGLLHDRWRVLRGGKLIYTEATNVSDFRALKDRAALGAARSFATVLFVDPAAAAKLEPLRKLCDTSDWFAGVSAWNGMLVVRAVADDPRLLRGKLIKVIQLIRGENVPRVWTM